MAVTCTKKFNWAIAAGTPHATTKCYFPGDVIEAQDAAAWAKMQGYAEERGEQTPARALSSPENKAADLKASGGENKRDKKAPRRAKNNDGDELVLGSEDEV